MFWERRETVEREGERREEEEEDGGVKPSKPRYGTCVFCMETNLDYGFYEIMYEFPCLVG